MAPKFTDGPTQEHHAPSSPMAAAGRPALVVAYPRSAAVPLPESKQPVGREWLQHNELADTEVSGAHLVFTRPGGALHVEDPGSRNGTWVDAHRLARGERVAIGDGALIRIGRTLLVYREDLAGDLTPAAPLGGLVGPYGLRAVAAALTAMGKRPPRNVLIEGETGAGKELAAAAVAEALERNRPYTAVNAAGIPAGVFESQLFGHVRGAFSDARAASRGLFVASDGGTVFLDEIGELPLDLQPKLLRLLENREVLPVGGERPVTVDVLVIAATNRALEEMVELGTFRRDLYARLAAAKIDLPPLRERAEDLFAIAQSIRARSGEVLDPTNVEIEAVERLLLCPWSSNVREVMATLDRVAAIDPAPGLRLWSLEKVLGPAASGGPGPLTADNVSAAMAACAGNESAAAKKLGVTRGKLRRFLAGRGA